MNECDLLLNYLKTASNDEEQAYYIKSLVKQYSKGKMLYIARKAGIKKRKALWLSGNRGVKSYRSLNEKAILKIPTLRWVFSIRNQPIKFAGVGVKK